MAYRLSSISIQTDTSPENMQAVTEIWGDIASGKIPLLYDSTGEPAEKLSPVTEYLDFDGVLEGKPYTMVIRTVPYEYFADLEERTKAGELVKYETVSESGSIEECSTEAWQKVQQDEKDGRISIDYSWCLESTVPPDYTPDHTARCYLYVKPLAEQAE